MGDSTARKAVHLLVPGLRISLAPEATSPGPRSHVLGVLNAFRDLGWETRIELASEMVALRRFARVRHGDAIGRSSSLVYVADLVRVAAALLFGLSVFARSLGRPAPAVIYERLAVLNCGFWFHARRRRSTVVLEVNGVMHRETSADRGALKLEGVAAVIERFALRRADVVVVVSNALKEEVRSWSRIEPSKIVVVPNGIEPEIERAPGRTRSPAVVGYCGSISTTQRLGDLLGAVASLRQQAIGPVQVDVVGDGSQLAALRESASQRGLSEVVTFRGQVSRQEALDLMATWTVGFAAHAATVTSTMYHSPLKLYEYAALGLTVVCTPSDDARDLLDAGVKVLEYTDVPGLAAQLGHAVTVASSDEDLTQRSQAFRRDQFSWTGRVARLLETIESRQAVTGR